MDTKTATRQFRLNQWAEIIRDRMASGLTIRQYCSEHNLSRNAYFYWLRQLRQEALLSSGTQFAELPVPIQTSSLIRSDQDGTVTIDYHGARIHIDKAGCDEILSMVLRVLQHAE